MKCSICQCENDYARYAVIAKDGHRWTWGRLCEECYNHRQQTTLAEGACIPPPAPPPSKIEEREDDDPEAHIWHIRQHLCELEDWIVHTQEGPSKPQACERGTPDKGGE